MYDMQIRELPDRDIMRRAQKKRGFTQEMIAERIGIKRNSLCQNMNRTRMSLNVFVSIMSALDYDIVIVDKETGEPAWKLCLPVDDEEDDI